MPLLRSVSLALAAVAAVAGCGAPREPLRTPSERAVTTSAPPEPAPEIPVAIQSAPEEALIEPSPAAAAELVLGAGPLGYVEWDLDRDARHLAILDQDAHLVLIDVPSGQVRARATADWGSGRVAFIEHPRPSILACSDRTGVLRRWDLRSAEVEVLPTDGGCAFASAPDRRRIAFAIAGRGVCIRTLASADCDVLVPLPARILRMIWSPDGTALVIVAERGGITIHDAASGALRARIESRAGEQHDLGSAIAVAPRAARIATTDPVRGLETWDGASGERLVQLRARGLQSATLAFSDDASALGWISTQRSAFRDEPAVRAARYVDALTGADVEPDAALRAGLDETARLESVTDVGFHVARGTTEIARVIGHSCVDRVRQVALDPATGAVLIAYRDRVAVFGPRGARDVPCLLETEELRWERGGRVSFQRPAVERRRTIDPWRCTAEPSDELLQPPSGPPLPDRVATEDRRFTAEIRPDRVGVTRASDGAQLWLAVVSDDYELRPIVHTDDLRFEARDADVPLVALRRAGPLLESELVPAAGEGLHRAGLLRAFYRGDPLP